MSAPTVSFCFDDGFRSSTEKTVRIFDRRGLKATFAVMARPDLSQDVGHVGARFGDWGLWREMMAEGYDIAPHGWAHERLCAIPHRDAIESLERVLESFSQELPDFRAGQAIFHAAYLALPDTLKAWILDRMSGVRVSLGGGGMIVPEQVRETRLIDCISFGPVNVGEQASRMFEQYAARSFEWQVLVLHGLDGEGWGSIAEEELIAIVDGCLNRGWAIRPLAELFESIRS